MTLPSTPTLIVNTEMQPTATAYPTEYPILIPKDTLHPLLQPPLSHLPSIASSLDGK